MTITLEQLALGFDRLAEKVKRPTDLMLDWRQRKIARQDRYWSEMHKIEFVRTGWYSPGRGRRVRQGDRYGFATGTTRKETTRSFTLQTEGAGLVLILGPTNSWAKFFHLTLIKRDIPGFEQGILPLTEEDAKDAQELGSEYIVKAAEDSFPR